MKYKVDSAVIMAAGISSRFAPLSYEKPKALIIVKGEVLIERQIRQLQEVGISNIIIVVGYKKEQFEYLSEQFGVILIDNMEYKTRNNNGSIFCARKYVKNTYICSCDNYFTINPFENIVDGSYYAALFSYGETKEWCMKTDENGYVNQVTIGGSDSYFMMGHAFWSEEFSNKFFQILDKEYKNVETEQKLWESIYIEHLDELRMKIRPYNDKDIFEFDSLDELRSFDTKYKFFSGSKILNDIAEILQCKEGEIVNIVPLKSQIGAVIGISFNSPNGMYYYNYKTKELQEGK